MEALRVLGAGVEELGAPGCLPVAVTGPVNGGHVSLAGHLSSQFLSALLLAGPLMRDGLQVELTSPAVSMPYLRMTLAVMAHFGARADLNATATRVDPGEYRACRYVVEPDASAASYWLLAVLSG
ncbi:MAG: hypothetical protein M3071_05030 [Actinomycetota bacterium]|nr:hypothetical protein [Actinomycetota bacterium]